MIDALEHSNGSHLPELTFFMLLIYILHFTELTGQFHIVFLVSFTLIFMH